MIYQCYFQRSQLPHIFQSGIYAPFALVPELNADLLEACPELATPAIARQLNEYVAMLYLWRRPQDRDSWIGFTSYRQLDKKITILKSGAKIESSLAPGTILTWGLFRVPSVVRHADHYHPGSMGFLTRLLARHGETLPSEVYKEGSVIYANYWIMTQADFVAFMEWSWPLILDAISLLDTEPFLRGHKRAIGYAMERLFIAWYLRRGMKVIDVEFWDFSLGRLKSLRTDKLLLKKSIKTALFFFHRLTRRYEAEAQSYDVVPFLHKAIDCQPRAGRRTRSGQQ